MFFSAIPVPLTTALNGSSATNTGSPVFLCILSLRPRNNAPPPARYIPVFQISAASSGGVMERVSITASSILDIELFNAIATSL